MGILRSHNSNIKVEEVFDPFESLDDSFMDRNLFSDSPKSNSIPKTRNTNQSSIYGDLNLVAKTKSLPWATIALLSTLLVLSGFAVARIKPWLYFSSQELVYAYFEVRAVDLNGRPVAGAVVKNGVKRVGTTDSFGEWRRYMRVPLGATIPVTIAKKSATEILFATKNFAVPPLKPEKNEIELRGSVQLQSADFNNAQVKNAAQNSPVEIAKPLVKGENAAKDATTMTTVEQIAASERNQVASVESKPTQKADASLQPTSNSKEASVQKTIVEAKAMADSNFKSDHETIWFEGMGSNTSSLNKELLPALVQRAKEIGLHVEPTSPWKIRLTNLIDKPARMDHEGGGLIMISSFDGENNNSVREFLRNYQPDTRLTARGILYILSHHINKNVSAQKLEGSWAAVLPNQTSEIWKLAALMSIRSSSTSFNLSARAYSDDKNSGFYLQPSSSDPCLKDVQFCEMKTLSYAEVPPVPSWVRLRLKAPALGKEPMKIFVSGYETRLVGDKVYEFWGQDRARANVTIVQNGRIVSRTQIIGDANNPAILGLNTISRR